MKSLVITSGRAIIVVSILVLPSDQMFLFLRLEMPGGCGSAETASVLSK